ncbi:MAG: 16S rRNA (guanine(527)-N(7))-methyltransferase RsmG [Bdellovibrionales bacterium RIFCSPHIGHO2_01_FULL_40_29]|nr:MAG: 16S rRNA (guanine(527)-N(7))-methyltransferase RsmG [Bdellovibrionales bacterium RIFCSPHIGHO2_01_FULL_40_29]OFZ34965.1 MAG: 16S rRNA (guanine(527)-N(7))-methyltransferase RsmG [Bdellovibrionales bacterium RIFCSPHIGHO2_02_FULL_40_15]
MNHFETRVPILLQLGFRESALPALQLYIEKLWSANEDLNLISRKMTFDELIDNHVIDSLLPLEYFPRKVRTIADLGSGGGLPAVIYALQFPHMEFYLFEKSPRKQEFLNSLKTIVPNIKVFGDIPPKLEKMDLITARGFKPIDVILEMTTHFYQHNGSYFLLKARREKIDSEVNLVPKKISLNSKIIPLKSPVLDVERHLVLIEKN